ncbi:sensor histidine kinase [Methylotuvimicrobium buryatense]|uniref:histidine kinase n=1 Tax=Methylotuvimicrobium buryatense TaxID=95641 RepID=A0A4P9UMX4_METBY|nr:ATP-binding protein [Methylotuvimicrobium buryatense]QCW82628.1 response regulator [Methylotuvimicrobium buryatense]
MVQSPFKIVAIEDWPSNQRMLLDTLGNDYNIRVAATGVLGLRLIQDDPPDLIFLKNRLQDMLGFEIIRNLRSCIKLQDIPVILLTESSMLEDHLIDWQIDNIDYIFEPINKIVVLSRVKTQLELRSVQNKLKNQIWFYQMEKMDSIRKLVSGIAHELNNPLGYVYSNINGLKQYHQDIFNILESAERMIESFSEGCRDLNAYKQLKNDLYFDFIKQDLINIVDESREGVERISNIVKKLCDFSRFEKEAVHLHDIESGIDVVLDVYQNELQKKATIIKNYNGISPIYCVGDQINQVFTNLLINAAQAIEEHGTITINTGYWGNDWLWVEIVDDGIGIPEEIKSKIFDPFFSTKPVGQGVGLGLALAYKIVKDHKGFINVFSLPGKGAKFQVYLPVNTTPNLI